MPKNNSIIDIKDILDEYSSDIQESISKEAQKIANEGKERLKTTSPKKTGDYRKGWRVKTTKSRYSIECIIHNATDYQLTHLLEKPHLKRNGKLSTPIVHIAPVEQKYTKEFEENVEQIIKNGG